MKNYIRTFKPASLLVLSLWVLSFLSLLVFFSGAYVRQQILALNRIEQRKKAYQLAKSAVFYALDKISWEKMPEFPSQEDLTGVLWLNRRDFFKDIQFKGGRASILPKGLDSKAETKIYGLKDEEGKVNLNYAGENVIANLLVYAAGFRVEDAKKTAAEIAAWRNPATEGDEAALNRDLEYLAKGYGYTPKNLPFSDLRELLLVAGMDPGAYQKIKNYLTVFGSGKVNINTACQIVFLALGLNYSLIEKINNYRSQGQRGAGLFILEKNIISDLESYLDLTGEEKNQLNRLISQGVLTCRSETFSGQAVSRIDNSRLYGKITFVAGRDKSIYYWSSNL